LAKFSSNNSERGFSLIETMVATGIMATAVVALAQMFAISVQNNHNARTGGYATTLAEQKMEQLRGLTYGFDPVGLPLTDSTSDTTQPTETPTGGTGLSPSPSGTLLANVNGYVDYIDQFGNILGGGQAVLQKAVYIRRWSIDPLPTNPNNTLVIQVMVTANRSRGLAEQTGSTQRLANEARIMSIKTRKAQ
jgi:prepilin-type N-terminal cleavage/methylation domain-containing protein